MPGQPITLCFSNYFITFAVTVDFALPASSRYEQCGVQMHSLFLCQVQYLIGRSVACVVLSVTVFHVDCSCFNNTVHLAKHEMYKFDYRISVLTIIHNHSNVKHSGTSTL